MQLHEIMQSSLPSTISVVCTSEVAAMNYTGILSREYPSNSKSFSAGPRPSCCWNSEKVLWVLVKPQVSNYAYARMFRVQMEYRQ